MTGPSVPNEKAKALYLLKVFGTAGTSNPRQFS
jgi:hypothetical protein